MKQVMQNIMLSVHIEKTIEEFMKNSEYVENVPLTPAVISTIMEQQESASDRIDVLRAALIPFFTETVASHKDLDGELNGFDEAVAVVARAAVDLTEQMAGAMKGDDKFKEAVLRNYNEHYTAEAREEAEKAQSADPLRAMFDDAIREVSEGAA